MRPTSLYPRYAERSLVEFLVYSPVVLIHYGVPNFLDDDREWDYPCLGGVSIQ